MNSDLSANSQAILLLTAPLAVGKQAPSADLLSLSEYNRLARVLRDNHLQPSDLLKADGGKILSLPSLSLDPSRLKQLLDRGFLLSQALERWNARSIWVVTRADPNYPCRLKARLKEDAPTVLYGCGDAALLETGGLAVVGSRDVTQQLIAYTEEIGNLTASARWTLISGGAKGIDRAAMNGSLQAGGNVIGVMSDSLERAAIASGNREFLIDRHLVFISPYDPQAGFNVGHAMQRNKLIYALSDAALVVTSDLEKGGTWAGAIEQLEKLRFVPVFVRNGDDVAKGNLALLKRGAQPWPEPKHSVALQNILSSAAPPPPEMKQQSLLIFR
jgi:DNA processing protein